MIKKKLHKIVIESSTRKGRVFDISIQCLIIISIITFSINTLPDLNTYQRSILNTIETVLVITFSIEYLLRVILSRKSFKFILSFFGIVDLFSILPFYLALGIDLRSLRALRLLRIFRILKLARYSKAMKRFQEAFIEVKSEMAVFFTLTLIMLFISASGIYFFENPVQPDKFSSIFDSLWWAVATLTTVGYGDVYPITSGGRIFTFLILMIGLGIVSIPAGLIASSFSKAR